MDSWSDDIDALDLLLDSTERIELSIRRCGVRARVRRIGICFQLDPLNFAAQLL